MKDISAEQNSQKNRETHNYNEIDALQHCYKQIGIPAVAAAARYQGDAKTPGPVASHLRTKL